MDHPNLEMAMTVSYVSNGIDGSQCAYQCLSLFLAFAPWGFYVTQPKDDFSGYYH